VGVNGAPGADGGARSDGGVVWALQDAGVYGLAVPENVSWKPDVYR
jgi:hypothetical protein